MNELVQLRNDEAVSEKEHCEKILKEVYLAIEELKDIDNAMSNELFDYMENNLGNTDILLDAAYKLYFSNKRNFAEALLETYERECAVRGYADISSYAVLKATISMEGVQVNNAKRVYLFELSNGTVKIGVSSNIERRITEIENQTGAKVLKIACTEETDNAFCIEHSIHEELSDKRVYGEYFSASFEYCKRRLEAFKDIAYLEINNRLLPN